MNQDERTEELTRLRDLNSRLVVDGMCKMSGGYHNAALRNLLMIKQNKSIMGLMEATGKELVVK